MVDDVYKNYVRDLGCLLREYGLEARQRRDAEHGKDGEEFYNGYLNGFYRVITLMQQQASGFQIPLEELGLDNLDPERELI